MRYAHIIIIIIGAHTLGDNLSIVLLYLSTDIVNYREINAKTRFCSWADTQSAYDDKTYCPPDTNAHIRTGDCKLRPQSTGRKKI